MQDKFEVGVVTSFHGLKGEVKVYPTTDDPARFREFTAVQLPDGRTLEIEQVRFFKGRPILKFRGLDRLEDVESLKGLSLFVPREDADPLKEGEYYIADLMGSGVYLEDGTRYGELADVLRTGANDVFVVRRPDGSEKLLPVIRSCVLEMDPEAKRIVVREMKEI